VVFFAAWQAEGLLARLILGSAPVSDAIVFLHQLDFGGTIASLYDFLAGGCSLIGATIEQWFHLIPLGVRAYVPWNTFDLVGAGITALFGWNSFSDFALAMGRLALELMRALVALNLAAFIYNLKRRAGRQARRIIQIPLHYYGEGDVKESPAAGASNGNAAARAVERRREYVDFFGTLVTNIGIILPGGGARGAYQAGALQAVYDFLREYNALGKVRMIAATSVGAWNAMFWLADMMRPSDERSVSLRSWWGSQDFARLMEFPRWWLPFFSEGRFSCVPWREQFIELFADRVAPLFAGSPALHFYLTRSDPALGALRYATNWTGLRQRLETLGLDNHDGCRFFEVIAAGGGQLERMADAVFRSLDPAPLFPGRSGADLAESGDALDPIPLRFAAPVENCDLVFVLPSQGSPELCGRARLDRMSRLGHMQQSAMIRKALKNVDTLNRIAERFDRLGFGADTIASAEMAAGISAEAAAGIREEVDEFNRSYKRVYTFTACPVGDFPFGPLEYGNRAAAAHAFALMYEQTRTELRHRLFEDIDCEDAHLVMVDGMGKGDKGQPPKPSYRRVTQL
jgi:hypothetical protein